MKHSFFLFLSFLVLSVGCNTTNKPTTGSKTELKLSDVAYGTNPRNIMDVYLPANRNNTTPFAILIHGGGWVGYGKEYIREYQDSLLANGIAVASMNHRYANDSTIHYTQMLEDVDNALNYCIAHAKEWNTRKDYFVMTGVSSGGHLALLYGFTSPKKINAIVEFCAPTNLADTALLNYAVKTNLIDLIQKMTGKKYAEGKPLDPAFALSSPINHIKNIPVLIVQGNADLVVPYSQSVQLNQALEEKGIVHKLVTIPNAGHDLNLTDPATRTLVYGEAVKWILKYGK